jgi:hemerythrin
MTNKKQLEWQKEFSVGIAEIDRQHKEIIVMVRDLSKLCIIDDKNSYEVFKMMLSSAVEYFKYHFKEEEIFMEQKNYPGLIAHKERHRKMLLKINEIIVKFEKDDKITINSVTEYLREWYKEHLLGDDRDMGTYFNAKCIKNHTCNCAVAK